MKTKELPIPLIIAAVGTAIISIPFHGVFQTMIITVCTIGVAMYARQSGINERSEPRY